PGSGVFSFSCQEVARRQYVDANDIPMSQKVVVVGDERCLRRGAQRREFPILWIRDEDEALRIDGASKLPLGLEKISNLSQARCGIRRRINSVSRRVGSFQIS